MRDCRPVGADPCGRAHKGYDINEDPEGGPVYPAYRGTVQQSGLGGGGSGQQIVIDHGNSIFTNYYHLVEGSLAPRYSSVTTGTRIGLEGNTGGTAFVHLHFEMRRGGETGDVLDLEPTAPGGYPCCNVQSALRNKAVRRGQPIKYNHLAEKSWFTSVVSPTIGIAFRPDDATTSAAGGQWLVSSDGAVFAYGDAQYRGGANTIGSLNEAIVGIARSATTDGYWLVGADGGIFSYQANFHGSTGNLQLAAPIVGIAAPETVSGYWFVAQDGGVFSFGGAPFHGSAVGASGYSWRSDPIVGMAARPDASGYWLVSRKGRVFAFGSAAHQGNGPANLSQGITGVASTPSGGGYWLVAADGGLFTFGDASFHGSAVGNRPSPPEMIVGIGATPGGGYRLADSNRGIFAYGPASAGGGGGGSTLQGTGSGGSMSSPNSLPIGNVEVIGCDRIAGWAFDSNDSWMSVNLHVSVDWSGDTPNVYDFGTPVYRPDVNDYYKITGNHGFDFTLPSRWRDGNPHAIEMWVDDTSGTGEVYTDLASTTCTAPFSDDFTGENGWAWSGNKWTTASTSGASAVDIQGNEGRLSVTTTNAKAAATMAPVADVEALMTYRLSERSTSTEFKVTLRASGTMPSDVDNGYRLSVRSNSSTIKLYRTTASGGTTKIGEYAYTRDTAPQWLRYRVQGSSIKVKTWAVGTAEPAAWNLEVTDTGVTGTGTLQFTHNYSNGSSSVYVDNLSLARL